MRTAKEETHEYTAFFVCRNPVEKLLSVYQYLIDMRVSKTVMMIKVVVIVIMVRVIFGHCHGNYGQVDPGQANYGQCHH